MARDQPSYSADARHRTPRSDPPLNALIADAGGLLAVVARGAAFAGIAGAIGACALRFVVLRGPRPSGAIGVTTTGAIVSYGVTAALLAGVAILLRITAQAQAFASPDEPLFPVVGDVLRTDWGRVAAIQVAGVTAAFVGMSGARTFGRWGWATAVAGCCVLATTPAFMGHAVVAERWRTLAIAGDVLHVLAGGAWAGGLGALAWTMAKLARFPDTDDAVATLIDRFGPLAIAGASTLLATGVLAAAVQLRAPSDVLATSYGRILLVKVAVVATAAVLGRRHSLTAARDVRAGKRAAVARSIAGEVLVMVVVFSVTALLAGSPTPGE